MSAKFDPAEYQIKKKEKGALMQVSTDRSVSELADPVDALSVLSLTAQFLSAMSARHIFSPSEPLSVCVDLAIF